MRNNRRSSFPPRSAGEYRCRCRHVVVVRKGKAFRVARKICMWVGESASDADGRSSKAPLSLLLLAFLAAWVHVLRAAVCLRWRVVGSSGLVLDVLVVHVHRLVDLGAESIIVGGAGTVVSMSYHVVTEHRYTYREISSALSISSNMPVILPASSGCCMEIFGYSASPSICFCCWSGKLFSC